MNLPFVHEINRPLAPFCTLGIGGAASFFATATTPLELQLMIQVCAEKQLRFMILGKGSNILFDDRGFKGLVILNKIDTYEQNGPCFTVGSGYSFARLGGQTARLGYSGLEFASGIPATVGGAVYMNAGASGSECARPLKTVDYISETGERETYHKEELSFGYRTSPFQKMKGAIVGATFELHYLPEAKEHQRTLLDYRLKTQPYKDKSAGCIFRNPPGGSAGRLIEECGLKGSGVSGAQVSKLHANFLINASTASAHDFKELIELIKKRVYEEKGILLEEEIRYIPYDES